ncbi:putative KDPG/KHG aldolase, aldolase-type TIM barrel [Helianthus annuus]|nr:putative KDPG/KHG aldolase, aldolase-type TIM barrel [Helianthus annuus]
MFVDLQLEIVVSTPGVFEVLHQLVQDFPTTTLGVSVDISGNLCQVGTVLNTKDAENAKNAGAKFIMSPAIVKA